MTTHVIDRCFRWFHKQSLGRCNRRRLAPPATQWNSQTRQRLSPSRCVPAGHPQVRQVSRSPRGLEVARPLDPMSWKNGRPVTTVMPRAAQAQAERDGSVVGQGLEGYAHQNLGDLVGAVVVRRSLAWNYLPTPICFISVALSQNRYCSAMTPCLFQCPRVAIDRW